MAGLKWIVVYRVKTNVLQTLEVGSSPAYSINIYNRIINGIAKLVRRCFLVAFIGGSSPSTVIKSKLDRINGYYVGLQNLS